VQALANPRVVWSAGFHPGKSGLRRARCQTTNPLQIVAQSHAPPGSSYTQRKAHSLSEGRHA